MIFLYMEVGHVTIQYMDMVTIRLLPCGHAPAGFEVECSSQSSLYRTYH